MDGSVPKGATYEERMDDGAPEIVVTVRWFQGMAVVGLIASLIIGLPGVILIIGGELGLALVPGATAALLFYWSLATVLNRTTITLGRALVVRHGPVPWMGGLEASLERVRAFELREQRFVRNGRHVRSNWQAVAIVWGEPRRLLHGVSTRDVNRWLATVCQRTLAARQAIAGTSESA
jgi:hypothetical protein